MDVGAGSAEEAAATAAEATREESQEGRIEGGDADEALLGRAQRLVSKIMDARANPNPRHIHALAAMLESQETRYMQESGSSSFNNGRGSHVIGRLGNLIQDNDDFYDLVSSKFLSENRYSVSVRAATARLILSCSSTWMYPPVFDDDVLENIKSWVMEDIACAPGDQCNWKSELGQNKPTDSEMLKTYSTGLLAMSLTGGGQLVEDVLTSGLSAKLMRYLRMRVIGEASASQKDVTFPSENKHASGASLRCREENRRRLRPVTDATRSEPLRIGDEISLGDQSAERERDRSNAIRMTEGEECWADSAENLRPDLSDSPSDIAGMYQMAEGDVEQIEEKWCSRDLFDVRSRGNERHGPSRSSRDEDGDENDLSRRRMNRGLMRARGKGRINEGSLDSEQLTSPSSESRVGRGRGVRDRNFLKSEDAKTSPDIKNSMLPLDSDCFGNGDDDRFRECTIGSRDISDLVKKATQAAEAEARIANAPPEAVKAAGDAAAELVKTSALEAWKSTKDEEAAVLAASKAASTVVDAAIATDMSRQVQDSSNPNEEPPTCEAVELEKDESEEFCILDEEPLAELREKYCIQCLEILGEYVEALGPVLHEKGVDVCLALLQRCFKNKNSPQVLILLPEVLKLICTLAAHRKFAAVFIDRGGIQKLLSIQRVPQTFFGLSSCLFTIGTLQGIMERVCALPSDIVNQVVELALQLLSCSQDQARKNAAIFFAAAFVFRAVLDSFDAQEGLQKMLNLLHGTASVRSGGSSGTPNLPNLPTTLRNDRSPADVLTSLEKQIAYQTCVALRQYYRAHLLLLVDSLRPNKSSRSLPRHSSSARAAYKPLDISNEAMDAVFLQIQRDRKLGAAFVRTRWPPVDYFLFYNGHIIMLELCHAPPAERYLHDLAQYALGVLHIVTLFPYSRKMIVNATLSNDRVGMAVILDAVNSAGGVDPEVIQQALNVLVNLVCPPPAISNKPPTHGQQSALAYMLNGAGGEGRERYYERSVSDRATPLPVQSESRERNGEAALAERGGTAPLISSFPSSGSNIVLSSVTSGVVGDRRISLGSGAGCAGLAAQLEQGYRQARESVRANNGIKVLLHLLHPRMITPPATLDCLRALSCRVLLGLARDETIAHILTQLQVGKKLSELIRDHGGGQSYGAEQGRWHTELAQVAIELISIVTNSGRACTLAATDAAAPTLRRIERAAIAAATPITYHSRELLLLIHEHLQASGLAATAASLQKEAQLAPLPYLAAPQLLHQAPAPDAPATELQWPAGRAPLGFLAEASQAGSREEEASGKLEPSSASASCKKKQLQFSSSISQGKAQGPPNPPPPAARVPSALRTPSGPVSLPDADAEPQYRTPIVLPMKRKFMDSKDAAGAGTPAKRISTPDSAPPSAAFRTPTSARRSYLAPDSLGPAAAAPPGGTPGEQPDRGEPLADCPERSCPGAPATPHGALAQDPQVGGGSERVTLDSLVVQYLKHQHRQCPAPITTLPPLSLLQPHLCPEPSRSLDAPANVTARMSTREFRKQYGGSHGHRRDRQFVYSRFRPLRSCRDDAALLTCVSFLGDASRIVAGSHSGELKVFNSDNGNVLENQSCHQSPVTLVQSAAVGESLLVLSSGTFDARLWDAASLAVPLHSFEGCKAARFSHSGAMLAALSAEAARREVLLYDVQTCDLIVKLSDGAGGPAAQARGHAQSPVHFSPLDTMLLWNGVLWDRRVSSPLHRFDQFTDYGGGGFHPSGNEVIINSEVWDLRKFRLLRSVMSLDQTVISFNASGDIIYAILRRNLEDLASAVQTRRVRHPLFPAFRTVDAVNYADIATVPVDRCVLDLATEPTDSVIAVVAMDDHEEMFSSARLYEIGRRRPTDDDSDPDDAVDSDEEDDDEDEDSEADVDSILGADLDGDGISDAEDASNDDDDDDVDSGDELDDDNDFHIDGVGFGGAQGILEIVTEGEDEDSEVLESLSSGEEADFAGHAFGF